MTSSNGNFFPPPSLRGIHRSPVNSPYKGQWRGALMFSGVPNREPLLLTRIKKWLLSGSWWRHQMETFSALLAICAGNSPVTVEFPAQRPVTRICDAFFDLHLNKRLSKQSRCWWFETPSRPLWRHCNVMKPQWWGVMSTEPILEYELWYFN